MRFDLMIGHLATWYFFAFEPYGGVAQWISHPPQEQ
jgi:hypothetical protein